MFIPDTVSIYELIDPNTLQIKYVGQTSNPATRFTAYTSEGSIKRLANVKLREWLLCLKQQSQKPTISIYKEVPFKIGRLVESERIKFHKDNGNEIFNVCCPERKPRLQKPEPITLNPTNPTSIINSSLYTSKQVETKLSISRSLLHQYRTGYYNKQLLIKDLDWKWNDGKIVYFQSAVDKLIAYKQGTD